MKRIIGTIEGMAAVVLGLILSAMTTRAIEGLRISVVQSNVVLGWPSQTNETFIVQWRAAFDTNTPWTTLATNHLAATDTNWTVFTHTNQIPGNTNITTMGGGSGSGGPPPMMMSSSTTSSTDAAKAKKIKGTELPPMPWDPGTWTTAKTPRKSGPIQPFDGPVGDPNAATRQGFYRVVRTGIHIVGATNGLIVSATIRMPIEVGVFGGFLPLSVSLLDAATSNSLQAVSHIQFDEGLYIAEWETATIENTNYSFFARATFGESAPYFEVDSTNFTVTTSNALVFPDAVRGAGDILHIDAKSIHTNGSYSVTIYGDPTVYGSSPLGTVTGVTGVTGPDGYLMANGSRGILLNATLQDGSRFAGDGFRMVLTTTGIGPSGTSSSVTATNFKPVLPLWPTNTASHLPTKYTVAYQPIFGTPLGQPNTSADILEAMMQNVVIAAIARWSNPGVEPGDATTPKMLWNQSDFTAWLVQNIRKEEVRNLFYFGHGGPSGIGSTNTVPVVGQLSGSLGRRSIQQALNNTLATVGTSSSNAHPYRFVFLYGCSTANGDLPIAFGIPKKVGMKKIDFLKNGLRPQAFVGWSSWKVVGYDGFINGNHPEFVSQFFVNWKNSTYPSGHPKAGFKLGLKDALDKTAVAVGWTGWFFNPYKELVIYGAEDLTFDDYYDPTP